MRVIMIDSGALAYVMAILPFLGTVVVVEWMVKKIWED